MSRLTRSVVVLMVFCALSGGRALAQDAGTLRGIVTDKQGSPLPGTTITVRSKTHPSVNNQGTVTNAKGEYRIPLLPAGNDYEISCAFPGLATTIKRPVDIDAGKVTTVDFILTEELVQLISVVAQGDIVDTEATSTSTAISTEFIAGLPILGRNYTDVLTLAPGVTDTDGDGDPNVKGAREVDFQLRISGVSTNDPFSGGQALDFNLEAVEEIQVITGALTAEYSSQGGVGLVTTRSGGNEFEGSFKLFYQSRSIDGDGASNEDIVSKVQDAPSFRTLRPFVTASGALRKDRLWYFAALEYIDEQEPVVFSAATRNTSKEGHRDFFKLTWQVNPEHKAALELYFEPTETAGNNIGPSISEDSDFIVDGTDRLFTARETAVFSPTVFLDSSLSYFALHQTTDPVAETFFDTKDDLQVYDPRVGGDDLVFKFLQRNPMSIIPVDDHYLFDLRNRTINGPFFLNQTIDGEQLQLREDLSFYVDDFIGSHTLKTGVEFTDQNHDEGSEFRPLVFKDTRSRSGGGNVFYSFQAPIPSGNVPLDADRYNIAWYVQDTWKPVPNLTVSVGARVDREVVGSMGRTPFDPAKEVDEYNRLALKFYDFGSESPYLTYTGPDGQPVTSTFELDTGQFILGEKLNFETNPLTDHYFCDLDGDGYCNGADADGYVDPSLPRNGDTAVLRSTFHRNNFDCTLLAGWNGQTGQYSGSGRECIFNYQEGFVREGVDLEPERISLGNTNVAPRLSVSYDPLADGKTKLYATWGRFYGSLFLDTVVRERRADTQTFTFDTRDEDQTYLINPFEGGFTSYQVSRDLRTPFTDELTLGLERELAPELAVKVVYTRRQGRSQLQDIDINHDTADRRGPLGEFPDGLPDDCLAGADPNPSLCTPDGQPDIEPLNPFFNQIFLLGNLNESDYRSLELVLTKRLHRNWQFETSYTWSEAQGNAEEFLSLLGDDPSQTALEDGFLSYDQRHVVKFNAITHLPKDIQIGGAIQYESGLPFSVISRDFVADNVGNTSFRTIFPTGQRNDQRNKSYWTFNTNFKKGITLGGRVKGSLSLDVFDLLNSDDLRIYSLNRATRSGLEISDPVDPATRQFGRRFQFGIELHF